MLYTASFYHPEHWQGIPYRISRAHPRGQKTAWEVQSFLYPSRRLLTEYQGGELDFSGLTERYREELRTNYIWEADFQDWLASLIPEEDLTLLCFEPEGEPCHRRVAAGWLLETLPELKLGQMR
ncbi:MAG: DUF488 domain-containing protein [Chloroflexi bacterium]|nr:DUF488 domain-containing protein [Chloroflexota bacterium]